jgi:hypothetical protein
VRWEEGLEKATSGYSKENERTFFSRERREVRISEDAPLLLRLYMGFLRL